MLLAHLSDFHFYRFPDWSGLRTKRILGLTNLFAFGRVERFNPEIARQAILSVVEDAPDAVVITGDLTAMGSPAEFLAARDALQPILTRFPTFVVPGNHDYYTAGAARYHRIEQYFGPFIRTPGASLDEPTYPTLHFLGDVAILGMNPNKATLGSAGRIDPVEAERLEAVLLRPEVARRFKVLLIHYPLFDHRGEVTARFWRRLENREILVDVLMRHPVDLVLHGHDHVRYVNLIQHDDERATVLYNSGSASFDRGLDCPVRATYNLYEIAGGELVRVVHKDYCRDGFRVSFDGPPAIAKLDTRSIAD